MGGIHQVLLDIGKTRLVRVVQFLPTNDHAEGTVCPIAFVKETLVSLSPPMLFQNFHISDERRTTSRSQHVFTVVSLRD